MTEASASDNIYHILMGVSIMTQQSSSVLTAEGEQPACRHHWIIQAATGPFSPGVCRNCGAQREFRNYVEAPYWNEEKARHREQAQLAQAEALMGDEDGIGDDEM